MTDSDKLAEIAENTSTSPRCRVLLEKHPQSALEFSGDGDLYSS